MTKKQKSIATQKASRVDETKSIDFKLVVSEAKERLAEISKTEIQGLTKVLEENLPIYLPDKRLDNVDRLIISLSDDTMTDVFSDYDPIVLIAALALSEAYKNNFVTAYKGILILTNLENGKVMGNLKRFYEDEICPSMIREFKASVGRKNAGELRKKKKKDLIKNIQRELSRVQKEHPTWNLTGCREEVAKVLETSLTTVTRYTKKKQ